MQIKFKNKRHVLSYKKKQKTKNSKTHQKHFASKYPKFKLSEEQTKLLIQQGEIQL